MNIDVHVVNAVDFAAMQLPGPQRDLSRSRVLLELLESVERDGSGSQRERASEFGVALGLVNAYLNFCIKKGLIRVKKIPARRYAYYLTPKGFAEKSRLAIALISNSFHSFRQARAQYLAAFQQLQTLGVTKVVLVGMSELAEVAVLSAADAGVIVTAILDPAATTDRFLGLPVTTTWSDIAGPFDGAVITDLVSPAASYTAASALLGEERVAVPAILGVSAGRGATE
jgi:hypothetical protein